MHYCLVKERCEFLHICMLFYFTMDIPLLHEHIIEIGLQYRHTITSNNCMHNNFQVFLMKFLGGVSHGIAIVAIIKIWLNVGCWAIYLHVYISIYRIIQDIYMYYTINVLTINFTKLKLLPRTCLCINLCLYILLHHELPLYHGKL